MSDIQKFIRDNLPTAQAVAEKIGVDPSIILGQWGLETGWGKSVAPGTNNLGNIKGKGVAATDNQTGSTDQYRAYQSPQQFADDFTQVVAKYPNAAGSGPDAMAYAKALKPGQQGGYAEDPNYAAKLSAATQTVRQAQGNDIDPSKIQWDGGAPGAQSVPQISAGIDPAKVQWDAAPVQASSADQIERKMASGDVPKAPAPTQKSPGILDYAGAAVEPLLTAGTSMIAQPVGGAARLLAAATGQGYESAKQIGNKLSDILTYKPQTQGGQEALSGLSGMASNVGRAIMDTPVGNALSAIGKGYQDTFVKGTSNPLLATINDQVPSIIANVAIPSAGKEAVAALKSATANRLTSALIQSAENDPIALSTIKQAANSALDAASKPKYIPNGDGTFTQVKPAAPTAASAAVPKATVQSSVPSFQAPELPRPNTNLAVPEQQANIDTMRALGLDSQRQSAITGDKFTAGQEYQHSKLDSPMGEMMREQLGNEQAALRNYANGIIKDTGATAATPEAVGQGVRAPLQALSEHYDNQVRGLYQAADQRAAGTAGVDPSGFGKLMDTDSMFAGKAENSSLRRGIRAYMKEQGIVDDTGSLQPITAQQAEGMRQYLNSQWSPQNSGLIGKIKESLDMDVAKAGGDDIYAQARALHAERKNTLDNPQGIASLLSESGPDGINKVVPDEKIGAKLTSMPTAQFEHVVNTLKNLPPELQPQGQQALSEIKGAIAKQIYAAGDKGGTQAGPSNWNAANVTRELNNQASKMALIFSPEELEKFQTLNRGGHILQTPSAYPGAAVQGHNLLQRGMIWAPAAAGGALGAHLGGWAGASIGSTVGGALASKMAAKADLANANRLRAIMSSPKPVTK